MNKVEDGVTRYGEVFHNFVSNHDNYLLYEQDEERRVLMIDSYDNQRDMKLQLDILVNDWRAKRTGAGSPPSESGLSVRSAKSEKSYASSRNSVKEKKRVIKEAKLEMETLEKRQELQRKLEQVEKGKAELTRKMELLNAKTRMRRAEVDLLIEQSVEDESGNGTNDYLKEHYAQNAHSKDHLLQPDVNKVTPISESQPVSGQEAISTSLTALSYDQPQLPLLSGGGPHLNILRSLSHCTLLLVCHQ